jgi:hypothetical protein
MILYVIVSRTVGTKHDVTSLRKWIGKNVFDARVATEEARLSLLHVEF